MCVTCVSLHYAQSAIEVECIKKVTGCCRDHGEADGGEEGEDDLASLKSGRSEKHKSHKRKR